MSWSKFTHGYVVVVMDPWSQDPLTRLGPPLPHPVIHRREASGSARSRALGRAVHRVGTASVHSLCDAVEAGRRRWIRRRTRTEHAARNPSIRTRQASNFPACRVRSACRTRQPHVREASPSPRTRSSRPTRVLPRGPRVLPRQVSRESSGRGGRGRGSWRARRSAARNERPDGRPTTPPAEPHRGPTEAHEGPPGGTGRAFGARRAQAVSSTPGSTFDVASRRYQCAESFHVRSSVS